MSTTWSLPPEVMIEVFSHLAPTDLDNASLVCKQWYEVLTNEASWRESFGRIFGTTQFNRVSSSLKWRTELISRMEDLRKWKRKSRSANSKNVSFNCHVNITHVFSYLAAARIIVFSQINGMGLVADPTKGKLAKPPIYTEKALQVTGDVTSVDGSRFGMIYGMVNGNVRALLYSQETRIRDYYKPEMVHDGLVSAAWMNKIESPKNVSGKTDKFYAITGSVTGQVFIWDIIKGEAVEYKVDTGVTHIDCDSRTRVVIACEDGSIWTLNNKTNEMEKIAEGLVKEQLQTFKVDFESEFLLCSTHDRLWRVSLNTGETVEFAGLMGQICALGMDMSPTNQEADRVSDRDVPGQHARYFAVATSAEVVYVYILQDEFNTGINKIEPIRIKQSPFVIQDSTRPSITAIAMNSSILLLGSFNGITVAFDLLTGEYLRTVSTRFSKRALNFRHQPNNDPGLYAITHLEVDQDSSNPHGIIVVGSAVQYFDFGASFDETAERKRGIKKRRRVYAPLWGGSNVVNKTELNKDIESDLAMMQSEDEHAEEVEGNYYEEEFITEGLSEEDQMKLALMMSEDANSSVQVEHENDDQGNEDDDDELEKAIALSLQETDQKQKQKVSSMEFEDTLKEDNQEYNQNQNQNQNQSQTSEIDLDDEEDEELKRAIALSLNGQSEQSTVDKTDEEIDEDLALAMKLSLQK